MRLLILYPVILFVSLATITSCDLAEPTTTPGGRVRSFGSDGIANTVSFNGTVQDVVVQSDNKILVSGNQHVGGATTYAVLRFNTDGTADTSFGSSGKLTTTFQDGKHIALDSSGRLIVGGSTVTHPTATTTTVTYYVNRYTTDGALDTTFNSTGTVDLASVYASSTFELASVKADSVGRVILAGRDTPAATNPAFSVARLATDGSVDATFTIPDTQISTSQRASVSELAVDPNDKVVIAGTSCIDPDVDPTCPVYLLRYNTDGALDTTFNTSGYQTTAATATGSLVVGSDSRIFLGTLNAGYSGLVRYYSDGSLDTTWGSLGQVGTPGARFTTQSDGSVVIAARGLTNNFTVQRLDADGNVDASFGDNGSTSFAPDSGLAAPSRVAIGPDGKIILGGMSGNFTTAGAVPTLTLIKVNP